MADMCDFFVSYNKADRRWAEWIAWQLEENHYSVTIQAWHAQTGKNFIAWMNEASINCGRTLALLSESYFTGKFSLAEWTAALAEENLLPVRIQDIKVKGLLSAISYIDLVDKEEEEVLEALLEGIQAPGKPVAAPAFPGKIRHNIPEPTRFPGSLPPIWNVPYRRNRNFTGREQVLDSLYDALRSGQSAALTQAISGLGGVGKTQLALEYAYRCRADYGLIWWIRSEEPTTLASDYALLAQELDLPQKDAQKQEVVIEAVHQHLSRIKDWLLIFDNAESKEQVYAYLPQGEGGHAVITSRNRDWEDVASSLPIHTWEPQESIAFLLSRTGQNKAKGAGQLADALGHLPLALEQAAAYIGKNISFAAYLNLLETRRRELWDEESPPLNYKDTVATTWSLSMDRVDEDEKAEAGRGILNFCAFLAPENIPRSFLTALADHVPEDRGAPFRDALQINRGIKVLSRYSLVEVSPESLSVHRLVQEVVQDRLQVEAEMWAEAAICVVTKAWPSGTLDHSAWPECERLFPHSTACIRQAETYNIETEEVALLASLMGHYLTVRTIYKEAEPLCRKALDIRKAVLGENHPDTATSYNNLGMLYHYLSYYEKAEPLFQKAIAIGEMALGKDHPSLHTEYSNLALLYRRLGRYDKAESLLQKVLSIRKEVLGENHQLTAHSYNYLAVVNTDLGNYEKAEPLFQKGLAIRKAVLGEMHEFTANSYYHFAQFYEKQGNFEKAESYFLKAKDIRETVLGEDHMQTASSYNRLGLLYQAKGRYEEAAPLLQKALSIIQATLGENHPNTITAQDNLRDLLECKEIQKG